MITTERLQRVYKHLEQKKTRTKWLGAVKQDALSLLDWLFTECEQKEFESTKDLEAALLDGAKDWKHYSFGCCAVADCDNARIAAYYSTPSELKRVRYKEGGVKDPSPYETWLDVQARALFQAWLLIRDNVNKAVFSNIRKEGRLWAMDITGAEYTSTVYARLKSDLTREIKKRGYIPAETL